MTELKLDIWKFFDVTHQYHVVLNPMSIAKIDELIELLKLEPQAEVLDIACGKGEILTRIAERYTISGVGVDISPFFVTDAKQKLKERVPNSRMEILNIGGEDYKPDRLFDLSMCIGASWVYKGHQETLRTLKSWTKQGGLILVGEPFWLKEPEEAYLVDAGETRDDFGTHYDNVLAGTEEGLHLLYTIVSNQDDWDRYTALRWYSTARFAEENKDDPDVTEIVKRIDREKSTYLQWGRDTVGWAIYLFEKLDANR
ncbi:SAM-dependent methyltransferase [Chloroflexota bacterium]